MILSAAILLPSFAFAIDAPPINLVTGYSVAFRNKALRDAFNVELKKMRANRLYRKILDKY